ncbi:phytanoyl-CoA dioxygenase family protein [Aquihabitans daechungensis]|uniref:phytanoyl-CoA dioxygenase family protein n=1 Tax=Aquihabitans daechungensis TaxID=1052257 RepID=UPI003B9E2C20
MDPVLEAQLASDGYVIVDLLDAGACEAARALCARLGPAPGDRRDGLFNDSWSTDRTHTRRLSEGLWAIFAPAVRERFVGHRSLICGTSVKWPGEAGVVPAHRDPTFLDEARYRSVGIFCAIEPIGVDRGPLEVLPGSHRTSGEVRVHQSPRNVCADLAEDVERRFRPIPLAQGQAVIYDHSLLHRSGQPQHRARAAAMCQLVPDGATPWYAVATEPGVAAVLEVDEEFFLGNKLDQLDSDAVVATCPLVRTVADPAVAEAP